MDSCEHLGELCRWETYVMKIVIPERDWHNSNTVAEYTSKYAKQNRNYYCTQLCVDRDECEVYHK